VLVERRNSGLGGAAQMEDIIDHLLMRFGCAMLEIVQLVQEIYTYSKNKTPKTLVLPYVATAVKSGCLPALGRTIVSK
jgi:hypothetical protein